MARIALGLAGLVALIVLWAIVLWFVARPDFAALSPLGLLALHGVPPVSLWLAAWLGLRSVRTRREAGVRAAEAAERRAREEAAARSRQQQREALMRRRMALPVLAAVIAAAGERDLSAELAPANDAIVVLPPDDDAWSETSGDPDAGNVLPVVERVLREVLSVCPAAAAFPVSIACPEDLAREAVIDQVRVVMADYWDARMDGEGGRPSDDPGAPARGAGVPPAMSVECLPPGAHPVDALFAAFDGSTLLPGMILLAVDSPRLRERLQSGETEALPETVRAHRRWHGAPAQAVIAFVVGSARLGELLASVAASEDVDGVGKVARGDRAGAAMRPYWEAGELLPASLEALAALDPEVRAELADAIPVGLLHRADATQFEPRPGRVGALAAVARRLLECGLVNAGQLPMPGLEPDAAADVPEGGRSHNDETVPPPSCDWLVHNAGSVDVAGERLAAVSLAMHQLRIDLNPIDEATNFPAALGDLGMALPLAMLVQAANKAAETAAPACWAHFIGADAMRIGMLTPGQRPLSAGTVSVAFGSTA